MKYNNELAFYKGNLFFITTFGKPVWSLVSDLFPGLKVLYMEGNALSKIENLDELKNLRCLYI